MNAQGVKRAYKFKPSDSRVLEEQALQRQLNAAGFMPATKEGKGAYSLSEGRAADAGVPGPSAERIVMLDGASGTAIV